MEIRKYPEGCFIKSLVELQSANGCLKARGTFKYKEWWCVPVVGTRCITSVEVLAGLEEICLVACAFR